jgi:RNA polymerase sigma factor for flagellar operon FliA
MGSYADVPTEVLELWRRHRANPTEETTGQLFVMYRRVSTQLARKALGKAPAWQDDDDIISYAEHGLLDAIKKYDPEAGVKFETYATRRVGGAIIDGQRQQDPLSRSIRKQVKDLEIAVAKAEEEMQRELTLAEMEHFSGMEANQITHLLLMRQSINASLNDMLGDVAGGEGGVAESGLFAQHSEVELSAELDDLREAVARMLALLPEGLGDYVLAVYLEGEQPEPGLARELFAAFAAA